MKELKKELKNEQLKDVNGGFSDFVEKHDAQKGEYYYCVFRNNYNAWFRGICVDTYEADNGICCSSVRTHKIYVKDSGSAEVKVDSVKEISGDQWDLYKNR